MNIVIDVKVSLPYIYRHIRPLGVRSLVYPECCRNPGAFVFWPQNLDRVARDIT